jgi:hypothetical protein
LPPPIPPFGSVEDYLKNPQEKLSSGYALSLGGVTNMALSVLPTGRYFGRRTQKRPEKNISGREKVRPILHRK